MNSITALDRLNFAGKREVVIQRDGEKCVKCGLTRKQHFVRYRRDITVDHIEGRKIPNANDLSNLQTLCLTCHARKDNRQNKLTDVQVINIRHMKGTIRQPAIAKLYGVSQVYVSQIHSGKWRQDLLPPTERTKV